jgi:hypothetical protein
MVASLNMAGARVVNYNKNSKLPWGEQGSSKKSVNSKMKQALS